VSHTPEPWEVSGLSIVTDEYCIAVIEDDGGYEAPDRDENGKRIVACVNAFAGIRDPQAYVAAVEELAAVGRLVQRGEPYRKWTDELDAVLLRLDAAKGGA
jgi:hypothetical protein